MTTFSLCASGHLPVKLRDYNNRLRVLVATYVTFSPDGTELLVNMGGEQVTFQQETRNCISFSNYSITLSRQNVWFICTLPTGLSFRLDVQAEAIYVRASKNVSVISR